MGQRIMLQLNLQLCHRLQFGFQIRIKQVWALLMPLPRRCGGRKHICPVVGTIQLRLQEWSVHEWSVLQWSSATLC